MDRYEQQVFANLQGQYKHFCPEWDYMAIDETTPEFEVCLCYPPRDERESNP